MLSVLLCFSNAARDCFEIQHHNVIRSLRFRGRRVVDFVARMFKVFFLAVVCFSLVTHVGSFQMSRFRLSGQPLQRHRKLTMETNMQDGSRNNMISSQSLKFASSAWVPAACLAIIAACQLDAHAVDTVLQDITQATIPADNLPSTPLVIPSDAPLGAVLSWWHDKVADNSKLLTTTIHSYSGELSRSSSSASAHFLSTLSHIFDSSSIPQVSIPSAEVVLNPAQWRAFLRSLPTQWPYLIFPVVGAIFFADAFQFNDQLKKTISEQEEEIDTLQSSLKTAQLDANTVSEGLSEFTSTSESLRRDLQAVQLDVERKAIEVANLQKVVSELSINSDASLVKDLQAQNQQLKLDLESLRGQQRSQGPSTSFDVQLVNDRIQALEKIVHEKAQLEEDVVDDVKNFLLQQQLVPPGIANLLTLSSVGPTLKEIATRVVSADVTRSSLAALEGKVKDLEAEKERWAEQLAQMQVTHSQQLASERAEYTQRIQEYKDMISNANAELRKFEGLKAQVDALQEEVLARDQQLQQLRAEHAQEMREQLEKLHVQAAETVAREQAHVKQQEEHNLQAQERVRRQEDEQQLLLTALRKMVGRAQKTPLEEAAARISASLESPALRRGSVSSTSQEQEEIVVEKPSKKRGKTTKATTASKAVFDGTREESKVTRLEVETITEIALEPNVSEAGAHAGAETRVEEVAEALTVTDVPQLPEITDSTDVEAEVVADAEVLETSSTTDHTAVESEPVVVKRKRTRAPKVTSASEVASVALDGERVDAALEPEVNVEEVSSADTVSVEKTTTTKKRTRRTAEETAEETNRKKREKQEKKDKKAKEPKAVVEPPLHRLVSNFMKL